MPLKIRFHPPSLLIVAAFALATWSVWAYFNQPQPEPAWPKRIQGFSFSPFHGGEDAIAGRFPSPEEIDSDLALLAGRTHAVRTYTVEGTLDRVPALAAKHDINVTLGAWVDQRSGFSEHQVNKVIHLAWHHPNVVRVIVGNEVLLRGDLPKTTLFGYLDRVRKAVYQPVSTAEPWDVWLKNPELAEHVDFIAVHMLPYWEGVDVDRAVDYVIDRYQALQKRFPGKPIVIAEVGWPSNGRTRESAAATPANEALFLRRFLNQAERRHFVYYVMEAFDQPWKAQAEGAVGAYWGVWNVSREPKFPFEAPLVRIPHWPLLAGLSVLIAMIVLVVMFFDSTTLNKRGRGFLAGVAFTAATVSVWVVYDYAQQYLSLRSVIVGLLLFAGMLGVILVLFTEAHEWVEAHWVSRRRRRFHPGARRLGDHELPFVSIHVPAYNEPPGMLIDTLNALAALDYPRFEVIVMDNNTPEPAAWEPVAAHCQALGPRFRFFHERPLAGFKGGALNYALRQTTPVAEVVAVIDSDYQVCPDWLRDLAPLFADPAMGIVQAPQDYRDADESLFKAMCYAEYRGFFYIGMITRNERNAIIQHGTMTLVRRGVLEAVGGWDEHCITEDAELGLRIFEHGSHAAYLPASYGRGLMPDTFTDYKKQRSRWAFGAMQILRRHAAALFGRRETRLDPGQRYHFLAGWLPWLADGFNLTFNLAALGWSLAMVLRPHSFDPPLVAFSALPLFLFGFKLAKLLHLYVTRVGAGIRQALGASLAGLGLTHTIGVAVLAGLFQRERAFFRTPKRARRAGLLRAFFEAREESLFALGLWLAAWGVAGAQDTDTPDVMVWIGVLLLQSIPYTAALLVAILSGLPISGRWLGSTRAMEKAAFSAHRDEAGESPVSAASR